MQISIPGRITAADVLLRQLSDQNRRILSPWRALILARRATHALTPDERRWSRLPETISDLGPTLRAMEFRGDIRPIDGIDAVYQVSAPYSQVLQLDEREIQAEVDPWSMVSHLSAQTFHGLTTQLPSVLMLSTLAEPSRGIVPVETMPEEWAGLALPTVSHPEMIGMTRVMRLVIPVAQYVGFDDYQPYGATLRVTTPERTLIDGLQRPDLGGGIENVFRAWVTAAPILDLDQVVSIVDRLGIMVLRQRVGFVLDRLGLSHPALEQWRSSAKRGGSSRLVGAEPFAPTYDERWNISINAPTEALDDAAA